MMRLLFIFMFVSLVLFDGIKRDLHASIPISPLELDQALRDGIEKVEQWSFLRALGKKYGVPIYLFGGTAAGFAHYVKQDLQRLKGKSELNPKRFDYDFTNIYRSTQDADIVVDGTADQAQAIKKELFEKYPHLQGDKVTWELRLLRSDLEERVALLDNPDFLNQHSDSHSVGLIEITESPEKRPIWRDLRAWKDEFPPFIKDVLESQLTFYFSEKHNETSRAKAGLNPPIFSVIRYLIKAFQFELEMRTEDAEHILSIIRSFDLRKDISEGYVSKWLERNGQKLFLNAVNLEFAADTLKRLGLVDKLKAFGNPHLKNSFAALLRREPLRSFLVGQGTGATAADLKIFEVSHETDRFLSWESITRAHDGRPNVFISREHFLHEAAAFGDGFYTKIGKVGGRGTGLTIRFFVNPAAREGSDFIWDPERGFVIFQNKNALIVNIEDLNLSILDFLSMLRKEDLSQHDQGILFKMEHRLLNRLNIISDQEVSLIQGELENAIHEIDELKRAEQSSEVSARLRVMERSTWWIKSLEFLLKKNALDRKTLSLVASYILRFSSPVSKVGFSLFHFLKFEGVSDLLLRWLRSSSEEENKYALGLLFLIVGNTPSGIEKLSVNGGENFVEFLELLLRNLMSLFRVKSFQKDETLLAIIHVVSEWLREDIGIRLRVGSVQWQEKFYKIVEDEMNSEGDIFAFLKFYKLLSLNWLFKEHRINELDVQRVDSIVASRLSRMEDSEALQVLDCLFSNRPPFVQLNDVLLSQLEKYIESGSSGLKNKVLVLLRNQKHHFWERILNLFRDPSIDKTFIWFLLGSEEGHLAATFERRLQLIRNLDYLSEPAKDWAASYLFSNLRGGVKLKFSVWFLRLMKSGALSTDQLRRLYDLSFRIGEIHEFVLQREFRQTVLKGLSPCAHRSRGSMLPGDTDSLHLVERCLIKLAPGSSHTRYFTVYMDLNRPDYLFMVLKLIKRNSDCIDNPVLFRKIFDLVFKAHQKMLNSSVAQMDQKELWTSIFKEALGALSKFSISDFRKQKMLSELIRKSDPAFWERILRAFENTDVLVSDIYPLVKDSLWNSDPQVVELAIRLFPRIQGDSKSRLIELIQFLDAKSRAPWFVRENIVRLISEFKNIDEALLLKLLRHFPDFDEGARTKLTSLFDRVVLPESVQIEIISLLDGKKVKFISAEVRSWLKHIKLENSPRVYLALLRYIQKPQMHDLILMRVLLPMLNVEGPLGPEYTPDLKEKISLAYEDIFRLWILNEPDDLSILMRHLVEFPVMSPGSKRLIYRLSLSRSVPPFLRDWASRRVHLRQITPDILEGDEECPAMLAKIGGTTKDSALP